MHIVIGILTAVAGLFFAMSRLQDSGAVDALNPFLWFRRAQWRKKYTAKPMYSLSEPLDVAGLLIFGVAKIEGELSKEQKQEILDIFEQEFHLNGADAQQLFKASSFILKDEDIAAKDISKIFERSQSKFTQEQLDSTLSIMFQVSKIDNATNVAQQKVIDAVDSHFKAIYQNKEKW